MKILALFLVPLIGILLTFGWNKIAAAWQRRRENRIPWQVNETSHSGRVFLSVCRPGQQVLSAGNVEFRDPDFDEKIAELRIEAEHRVEMLNQPITWKRRRLPA